MSDILVPELGESIVEARVARWLKQEGQRVSVGETLVELETDKIDLEVGATEAGVLARIERRDGEDVKIGDRLGVIERSAAATDGEGGPTAAEADAGPAGTDTVDRPSPRAAPEARAQTPPATAVADDRDHRATPTARQVAREHGIELTSVAGSGAGGRVTRRDVERHVRDRGPSAPARGAHEVEAKGQAPHPAAAAPDAGEPERGPRREERVRMSKRRLTIARRLVEAQRTAAMLTTFNEIDMSAVQDLRRRHKEAFRARHGVGLGITSFFVKAAVAALTGFPRLNAQIDGEYMVLKHYHDIGVAVGASGGLVVPVLRDAGRLSFAAIERQVKEFARKAEDGSLTLDDLRGGTFTITNGGIFGSLMSTPILNPPQVGILGLHKIEDRIVPIDGQPAIRPMMYVALSYDHRIVDGLEAVQFLVRVKAIVEDPASLLLEG